MTVKEIAYKLEEMQIESEKVNSLQNTLFEAIYRGDNAPEIYEWAFIVLGNLTFALANDLDKLTKAAFDNFCKAGDLNV